MDKDTIKKLVESVFRNHHQVTTLWQTLAEHFYPERADFTYTRNIGAELADNLLNSYPLLMRRDLGNSLSAMLRDGEWFRMTIDGEPDHMGRRWLEGASRHMRKMMYDRTANFIRAAKEGDHDYVTFGQCAITVQVNRKHNGLLYQCWHLRDCAWFDDENGQVCGVVRKWKPTYRQVVDFFKASAHSRVHDKVKEKPFDTLECVHLSIPATMWGDEDIIKGGFTYVSVFYDSANEHVMEVVPKKHQMYIIPRFQTIAGSAYAYSPATVVGLPDARCIQAMTHTLLEASERYARPPIIATQKAIRGDVDLSPDGITWVDDEYDERLGASLRPLAQDRGGYPIGMDMRQSVYDILNSSFYLNKINLPEITREMTAYEVSERMKQFRRENLPLFSPIEAEYSGALCELTFEVMMENNFLGSVYDIPRSLTDAEIQFKFESPLSQSEEEEKVTRFTQVSQMLAQAVEFDPAVVANVDFNVALRDAITGAGAPATWLTDPEVMMEAQAEQRKIALMQEAAQVVAA